MIRLSAVHWAVICLVIIAGPHAQAQDNPNDKPDPIAVNQVTPDEVIAASSAKNKVVIGSLASGGHGHVVIAVPGTQNVWDGNTLGGFKDLAASKSISNQSVLDRMESFINRQYPDDVADVRNARPANWKSATADEKQAYYDKVTDFFSKASVDDKTKYLDSYVKDGAPINDSWKPTDRAKVQWYQVPTDQNVSDVIKNYQPPDAKSTADQNLRCNDLVQKAAPSVRLVVVDEVKPSSGQTAPDITANNIDAALRARAQETRAAQPVQEVQRPPEPTNTPVYEPNSRERKVETKPGGVIITAIAQIEGLKPEEVISASFETSTGVLTLALRSGKSVTYRMDADDFTVAVRSVFDRQVDPSLSMSYTADRPGYKAVNYCGPLFKTHFGKVLYQSDELLGGIIFNREGEYRTTVAGIIPGFADLACESSQTRTLGSRVFLRATGSRFAIQDGRLVCRGIQTKVDVEGTRYAADYFQEPLHRLARIMDERFDALAENFDEFEEFRKLVECVALAKWIKHNSITFDWSGLKTRAVAETDFPAFSPSAEWHCLFNGRNVDGWRMNLATGEFDWVLEKCYLTLKPTGEKALELLSLTWDKDYDLRYTVVTEGPVEFIVRSGSGEDSASVTIDTKGRPKKIELFFKNGEWTAIAPGFGKKGKVTIPEPKKDQPSKPNDYGIRVPSGSKLTLFTASMRRR